jgi:hypothetical protein
VAALKGSETIDVNPPLVGKFELSGAPATATGGASFPLTITALDNLGRMLPSYNGTVTIQSSDPYATFPTTFTLTNGVGTTNFTLFTPTVRSIEVADTTNTSVTGMITVNVSGGTQQPATVPGDYAVGAGSGGSVTLFTASGTALQTYTPFGDSFTGGVRTAVADFNLDGTPDIAVGTGPGITAEVQVIDGKTGAVLFDVKPFGDFQGGVFVAEGDITGDGYPDLIITPDQSGGPRVEIFHGGDFTKFADFYGIDDPNFRGGARAAAGDINGDGHDDLVVSAGFSGGPRVSIFDGASLAQGQFVHPVGDFYAYSNDLRNGVYVAVGDVNGDGLDDLIFGAGPGGGPRVEIIDSNVLLQSGADNAIANPIANLLTGFPGTRGGIRVAAKNIDGDKYTDLVVGDGDTAGSEVRVYQSSMLITGAVSPDYTFDEFANLNAGVFVG